MLTAIEALKRLQEGNQRFASGVRSVATMTPPSELGRHAEGQAPFATILGCSDSRVPVEMIFDQGLGDLFVIRVAGNIAGPSTVGSIEFATDVVGVRLVVVLGHSACGAVRAAWKQTTATATAGTQHSLNGSRLSHLEVYVT